MSEKDEVLIKKVQPYPIKVRFEGNGELFFGNIIKLTLHGFLVELNDILVRVQQNFMVEFEIPVTHNIVSATAQVIKTYDHFKGFKHTPYDRQGQLIEGQVHDSVAVRIAEFHFKNLMTVQKEKVKDFLVAIGQVPR